MVLHDLQSGRTEKKMKSYPQSCQHYIPIFRGCFYLEAVKCFYLEAHKYILILKTLLSIVGRLRLSTLLISRFAESVNSAVAELPRFKTSVLSGLTTAANAATSWACNKLHHQKSFCYRFAEREGRFIGWGKISNLYTEVQHYDS